VAAKRSKVELDMPLPDLANNEVFIVDGETASINSTWDDKRGIVAAEVLRFEETRRKKLQACPARYAILSLRRAV
jgi:hypothetical protein